MQRHQSPERPILRQISSLMNPKIQWRQLHKNCNLIFIPRNGRNILVKYVSFYLERFQRYSVWQKVQLFGPPCRYSIDSVASPVQYHCQTLWKAADARVSHDAATCCLPAAAAVTDACAPTQFHSSHSLKSPRSPVNTFSVKMLYKWTNKQTYR